MWHIGPMLDKSWAAVSQQTRDTDPIAGLMLAHCRRRWAIIRSALGQCLGIESMYRVSWIKSFYLRIVSCFTQKSVDINCMPSATGRIICGQNNQTAGCRVVLSEAVDGCISFTRKNPTWRWLRAVSDPDPKVREMSIIFYLTVRPLSWACGHGTEMLLILKKLFLTW